MVDNDGRAWRIVTKLSVLALSSRFDGQISQSGRNSTSQLSVLALSSRFDGHWMDATDTKHVCLSVLALSSRFDGQPAFLTDAAELYLSVLALSSRFDGRFPSSDVRSAQSLFQYSLCRVVLMVGNIRRMTRMFFSLSVLALSSRFDGRRAGRTG